MIVRTGNVTAADVEESFGMKFADADLWKLDALNANPGYTYWGNDEDYMCEDNGWASPVELESAADLWGLDDLNELVNFYFYLERKSSDCPDCEYGYNPETDEIASAWYRDTLHYERWDKSIEQPEVEALYAAGRLGGFSTCPTAEEVNDLARNDALYHDAINHLICTKARAQALGVYGKCPTCDGEGTVFDEDFIRLGLQMWFILPRKGASRGVRLPCIESEEELDEIYAYLRQAAGRNAGRFAKVPVHV